DRAGNEGSRAWWHRSPEKAKRVLLPGAKDLNDFVVRNGDLRAWLAGEFARLGWRWPLCDPSPASLPDPARSPLGELIACLEARGLRLDGEVAFPTLSVNTITGRVGYEAPNVQNWPEADRLGRITPVVEGRVFIRADFGQIEPRILLAILRREGLIGWGPGEDAYRDLIPEGSADRNSAKRAVNRIINGGAPIPDAAGRPAEFITATAPY